MSIKDKMIPKSIKDMDMGKVTQMFKQFDENFSTLSKNQVFMQENQVEFESYLKKIIENQNKILEKFSNEEK